MHILKVDLLYTKYFLKTNFQKKSIANNFIFSELLKQLQKGCEAQKQRGYSPTVESKRVRRGTPNFNETNDDDDEDTDESSEGEVEETAREQRLIVRQRVTDLLALRAPGETFIQDAPCFQVYLS